MESKKRRKNYELGNLIYEKGFYPYQISERLGYTKGVAYAWIDGKKEPCARDMIRIAEILDVPVERIVRIFGEV